MLSSPHVMGRPLGELLLVVSQDLVDARLKFLKMQQ